MAALAETELGSNGPLAGRYQLLELIGSGGMGRVFRAHDQVLDREVAVKLLDDGPADSAELGPACAREARAAARLTHHGIARVFDSGVQDGRCFVVMELVPGRLLTELLREQGTLPPLEAAELAAQVADALDEAHRQGVIHCDVKPQNIIVTPSGAPRLVDFGIARAASMTSGTLAEEIIGSAWYLAPEQARGERLDARTDVYALGAVLYELLCGRPPFVGRNAAEIVAQKIAARPVAPRELNPNIPADLERAVLTALSRDPAERFQTAAEFRDWLRGAASQVSAASLTSTVPLSRASVLAAGTRPGARSAVRTWSSLSWSALAAAVTALVLGALLVVGVRSRNESQDQTAPPDATTTSLPTFQPTAPSIVAPTQGPPTAQTQAPPTAAPLVPPSRPNSSSADGAAGSGAGAERKADEDDRKKAQEAEKKADDERKKAEEKGQRGPRR